MLPSLPLSAPLLLDSALAAPSAAFGLDELDETAELPVPIELTALMQISLDSKMKEQGGAEAPTSRRSHLERHRPKLKACAATITAPPRDRCPGR
jgi:hypothetical protein